jgi:hypothetical protein
MYLCFKTNTTKKIAKNTLVEIRKILSLLILNGIFKGRPQKMLNNIQIYLKNNFKTDMTLAMIEESLKGVKGQKDKTLKLSESQIIDLLDNTEYKNKECWLVLSILLPNLNYQPGLVYEIDHLHPKSTLKGNGSCNDIANLTLLLDMEHATKTVMPLDDWIKNQEKTDAWRKENFIPDVDLSLGNFDEFLRERKRLMREFLVKNYSATTTK